MIESINIGTFQSTKEQSGKEKENNLIGVIERIVINR